jgi:hypothetical protein
MIFIYKNNETHENTDSLYPNRASPNWYCYFAFLADILLLHINSKD